MLCKRLHRWAPRGRVAQTPSSRTSRARCLPLGRAREPSAHVYFATPRRAMWSVDAQTLRRLFTSRAVAQAVREAERNWARGGLRTRLVDSVGKVLLPPSTYTVFPRDHRARTHATHWGLAARGLSQRPLECHTPTLVRQILPRASGFGAGAAPTTPPQVSSSRSGLAECCPPCDMWRTMRNFAMQWRGKRCLDVTRRL